MENKQRNRRIVSQTAAVMVKNLLMLLVGMSAGYVGIIIPSLTDPNSKENIYLNEGQTSWTSAILPITSLVGSILSGAITDPLGRKGSMIILTIPCLIAWISYYFAQEGWHIFASLALHGVTNGLIEAPVLTYVAEVAEPQLRGVLSSTTLLSGAIGVFLEFFLGSLLHWRTVALATCAVPIITLCLLLLLPETPYWLLSQNKAEEALKSLAWLRGWTTDVASIEKEFKEIQEHVRVRRSNVDNPTKNGEVVKCKIFQRPSLTVKSLVKRNFLYPLFLIAFLFIWANFIGIGTTQAYSVVIFSTFKTPINKYYATVLMSSSRILASIVCIIVVRLYGKRKTALVSALGLCICNVCVGIYAYLFDVMHLNFTNDSAPLVDDHTSNFQWIPLFLLIVFGFVSNCGPANLPWTLIGEVFSNDTRAVGCGLATSFHYISAFIANIIYLDMISLLTFPGVYWIYALVCIIGLLVIYFLVPETDGETLDDVSHHFSNCKLNSNIKKKSIECRSRVI